MSDTVFRSGASTIVFLLRTYNTDGVDGIKTNRFTGKKKTVAKTVPFVRHAMLAKMDKPVSERETVAGHPVR